MLDISFSRPRVLSFSEESRCNSWDGGVRAHVGLPLALSSCNLCSTEQNSEITTVVVLYALPTQSVKANLGSDRIRLCRTVLVRRKSVGCTMLGSMVSDS